VADLFGDTLARRANDPIGDGAVVLRAFAGPITRQLIDEVDRVSRAAPFRHMVTPGGYTMSVAMTNCGELGWVTDRRGYRYQRTDPLSGDAWPAMSGLFCSLASQAAQEAGYTAFQPDACLINRYEPGTRLSLHQDHNEKVLAHPIVSVSIGLSGMFLFGGLRRSDKPCRVSLEDGDIVVWGGPSRLAFHGVEALKDGVHALTGRVRINLTFRKAG